MSELRALRQRIRDAFAETPQPPPHGYAKRLFGDRRWKELRGERIDAVYEELPQLAPDEFRYYLPAYLMRALDAIDGKAAARGGADDVLEFTLYALTEKTNEMLLATTYANTRVFSDEERAVVRMFLEAVGAWDEEARRYQEDVASALRRFG